MDKKMIDDNNDRKLNTNRDKKKEGTLLDGLWEWTKSLVLALAIALLIKTYLVEPTQVQGMSMEHTLHTGDRMFINKVVLKIRPLKRGEIIVMHYNPANEDYIKRVIGLPGDLVQLIDGNFYINGKKLKEDYIFGDYTHANAGFEWRLKDGEYFVAGDNRNPGMSKDSRVFGPVNIKDIKGIAHFRFYPFGESFGGVD